MVIPKWNDYDDLFKDAGEKYNVEWKWLKAIALNESFLGNDRRVAIGLKDPKNIMDSTSRDGKSWGLMQMTLKTARSLDMLVTAEKLNDPAYCIDLSAHYVSQLQGMFSYVDLRYNEWVIKSYNQGPGNTFKEKDRKISGYAQGYWEIFQKNLKMVEANSGNEKRPKSKI